MVLSAEYLTMKYRDGESDRIILQDISVEFKEKTQNILIGPSGSGKSTLLYLLSTLRNPTTGVIRLGDETISFNKNAEQIRYEKFGFIFQQAFLLPYLNAKENICMAQKDKNLSAQADEWLERLNLSDLAYKYPYQMSGGERQRIAIIRALIKKPCVVFADEPTAALDQDNARLVFEILKQEMSEGILIVATHDHSLLNGEEQIYKIDDKKLIKIEAE